MLCPFCKEKIDDDAFFCDFCGKNLADPPIETAAGEPAPQLECSVQTEQRSTDFEDLVNDILLSAKKTSFQKAMETEEKSDELLKSSDCNALQIKYATNKFLLVGTQLPLLMKIKLLDPQYQQIFLWCSSRIGENEEFKTIDIGELKFNEETDVIIPFFLAPGNVGGVMNITFYFGCISSGECKFYQLSVSHMVYAKDQSPQSVVANISASEGSVVELGHLKSFITDSSDWNNDLVKRANTEKPVFETLPLTASNWRPEQRLLAGSVFKSDMLTLTVGTHKYHLCGLTEASFGRKAEMNDFVILDWVHAASQSEWPNNTVSRNHMLLKYNVDNILLTDTSSYGTLINGRQPADRKNSELPGNICQLDVGCIKFSAEPQFCLRRKNTDICKNCAAGKSKSLVLKRNDKLPETFVLIWQCCDLGNVIEGFDNTVIYRRGGGFIIELADHRFMHLEPGTVISLNEHILSVSEFKQENFSN